MNLWRKPDINHCHHFIWLLNLLHQVSHSNSKTTVNADLRGNKGSRIVIEAIDKKLALLFVKQGGSSVSAALLNGVAFFAFLRGASRLFFRILCFRTSFLPEKVQISFMLIKLNAKLLPAALFAQNMCSWFNLYSIPHLLQYYDLFA